MSSSNIEIIIFRILQPNILTSSNPGMVIIRCALPGTAFG